MITKVLGRVSCVVLALPVALTSFLGVIANQPISCGRVCAGDDLQGSLFWMVFWCVPLLVSIIAALLAATGRFRLALSGLVVATLLAVVALFA